MLNSSPPHPLTLPSPAVRAFAWPQFALGLAALIVVMFAPLRGGFFQYDDFILLGQAQHGWSWAHPLLFFTISQNGLFTPLNNLLFWLEFRAFGLHPLGYECVSLALHWANTLLVALLAWRLTRSRPAAWAAAIAFAVGFGKLEAVTWIAAFVHLVTTLCYLASVACFLSWLEQPQKRLYALALLFFVLGMLSKEPIVTLPLTIAAASLCCGAGDTKQRLRAVLPFFVLGAFYAVGMAAWQKVGPAASFLQTGVYKPGVSSVRNFGALGGVLLPAPYDGMLRFLAHVPHLDTLYRALTAVTAILVAPFLAWCWVRGSRSVRFGVLWILISFLPFAFVAVGIAPRYLYLPSVGFSLALAGLVRQWLMREPQSRAQSVRSDAALPPWRGGAAPRLPWLTKRVPTTEETVPSLVRACSERETQKQSRNSGSNAEEANLSVPGEASYPAPGEAGCSRRTKVLAWGMAAFALANMALFGVWQRQQNRNGDMRQALIRQMVALPARAPQTAAVCVGNVSSKFHDLDLALPLWIPHAPHFMPADACQSASGPAVHYTFQDGRLTP